MTKILKYTILNMWVGWKTIYLNKVFNHNWILKKNVKSKIDF